VQYKGEVFFKIDYLRSFYYTARCKSISKASETLHISQPGLSKQLQKLEEDFEATLFERSNKGVILTKIGKKVFDYAESILQLEKNLYNEIEKMKNKEEQLNIAACQNFGSFYFASKIHKFEKDYSNLQIKINTYNSSKVLNKVLNHDYTLGILVGMENCDHLFFEKDCQNCPYIDKIDFFEDQLVLCASQNFDRDLITTDEIEDLSIIIRENDSSAYNLINDFLNKNNINIDDLNLSFISNSVNITKQAVINGDSLAFLPKSAVTVELARNVLKIIDIDCDFKELLHFKYSIIKRKDYQLNDEEEKFKNFILSV
jgi:DNA-binding transcriptional LysR family regulator